MKKILFPFRKLFLALHVCVVLSLLGCTSEPAPQFRIAMASEATATPFYILSTISKDILWSIQIVPDEAARLDLLLSGEVDAIEYDIIGLYNYNVSQGDAPLMGILPISTSYALIGRPDMSLPRLTRPEELTSVDYQGIRSFLLYHWLKGGVPVQEMVANDQIRSERLTDSSVSAVVVGEPILSDLAKMRFPVLSSTQGAGLAVGTLVGFRSIDPTLIKKLLLNYQQMINQFDYIKKSPERFLMKDNSHFKPEWLHYIPLSIYFSPQLFYEVDYWIRLTNPTIMPLTYEQMFWLDGEDRS